MAPLLLFLGLQFSYAAPAAEPDTQDRFLIPIFYYTPETSAAGGAMLVQNFGEPRDGRTSHLISVASLTVNGQYFVNAAPKLYSKEGVGETSAYISYRYYPSKFFGRTVDGALDEGERFTERTFDLNAQHVWNFYSQWSVRVGGFYEKRQLVDFETAGRMAAEAAAISENYDTVTGLLGLEWDERDYPQAPTEGTFLRLGAGRSVPKDVAGTRVLPNYTKSEFDLRTYVPFRSRGVFAFQLLFSEVEGDVVPFSALNSIGGGHRLRGFYAGRYRDNALGLIQTEARWSVRDRWVATVGLAAGRLGPRVHDLGTERNLVAGTVGAHYIVDTRNRTKIRADLGFAEETGFYLLVGEAF